jgi:hypothetical protein
MSANHGGRDAAADFSSTNTVGVCRCLRMDGGGGGIVEVRCSKPGRFAIEGCVSVNGLGGTRFVEDVVQTAANYTAGGSYFPVPKGPTPHRNHHVRQRVLHWRPLPCISFAMR